MHGIVARTRVSREAYLIVAYISGRVATIVDITSSSRHRLKPISCSHEPKPTVDNPMDVFHAVTICTIVPEPEGAVARRTHVRSSLKHLFSVPWLSRWSSFLSMETTSPKITSNSFLIHLPHNLSPQPIHITITQLLPSTSILLHVATNRNQPRLSDVLVVSMPRGTDAVSSRLEGLGGLDEDMDRLARLLGMGVFWKCTDL